MNKREGHITTIRSGIGDLDDFDDYIPDYSPQGDLVGVAEPAKENPLDGPRRRHYEEEERRLKEYEYKAEEINTNSVTEEVEEPKIEQRVLINFRFANKVGSALWAEFYGVNIIYQNLEEEKPGYKKSCSFALGARDSAMVNNAYKADKTAYLYWLNCLEPAVKQYRINDVLCSLKEGTSKTPVGYRVSCIIDPINRLDRILEKSSAPRGEVGLSLDACSDITPEQIVASLQHDSLLNHNVYLKGTIPIKIRDENKPTDNTLCLAPKFYDVDGSECDSTVLKVGDTVNVKGFIVSYDANGCVGTRFMIQEIHRVAGV